MPSYFCCLCRREHITLLVFSSGSNSLEYIRVMSKELERKIKGCVIESCCGMKLDRLIQCDNVMCVDIKDISLDEGSNVESTGEGEHVDSDYISRL